MPGVCTSCLQTLTAFCSATQMPICYQGEVDISGWSEISSPTQIWYAMRLWSQSGFRHTERHLLISPVNNAKGQNMAKYLGLWHLFPRQFHLNVRKVNAQKILAKRDYRGWIKRQSEHIYSTNNALFCSQEERITQLLSIFESWHFSLLNFDKYNWTKAFLKYIRECKHTPHTCRKHV